MIIGKFEETLGDLMNSALKIVDKWCIENGLTVNPQKTNVVLFTKKYKIRKFKLPVLNGTRLNLVDPAKFLGVILDKKLDWKEHIKERIRKATNIFWQCRCAFGKTWGLKPKVVLWLYTAIIRPILCYGSHLWYHKAELNCVKQDIEHVQRMILVGVTGVMKTTPTKALEILLSTLPLDLFLKREALVTG